MTHECDQFIGRQRQLCMGSAGGVTLDVINAWRAGRGLAPLSTKIAPQNELEQPQPDDLPPLLIRGWNFATAMVRWASAGMPRRTQLEIDARLAICQSCEYLNNNHCSKCGCACNDQNRLINKLALATESCPLGKWVAGGETVAENANPPPK